MSNTYHINVDGESYGPYGLDEFKAMVADGTLTNESWVSVNGGDWITLQQLREKRAQQKRNAQSGGFDPKRSINYSRHQLKQAQARGFFPTYHQTKRPDWLSRFKGSAYLDIYKNQRAIFEQRQVVWGDGRSGELRAL